MVRAIENEAILGKAVDIWGVEGGLGIVNLQIEGRLVVGDDEKKVGLLGESQRSESEEEDKNRHTLSGNEIPNLRRSQKESGHELGRVPIEMERVGLCVFTYFVRGRNSAFVFTLVVLRILVCHSLGFVGRTVSSP